MALAAGIVWGSKLGVQFSLSLIALKALPVLILGGFTSIPGAIVGGLIIGAGEKLAEVLLAPVLIRTFDLAGGGIENWFAYVLALVFFPMLHLLDVMMGLGMAAMFGVLEAMVLATPITRGMVPPRLASAITISGAFGESPQAARAIARMAVRTVPVIRTRWRRPSACWG